MVLRPAPVCTDIVTTKSQVQCFWREMREGLTFLRGQPSLVLLGVSWSLFLGAMVTNTVLGPTLSDRIYHAGAVGYGWFNAGWGTGAFLSAFYVPSVIALLGGRRAVAYSMALMSVCVAAAPVSAWLILAILLYFVVGSARGVGGVAMNTILMETVPKYLMGRVQNVFYFGGVLMQLVLAVTLGAVAQKVGLVAAFATLACAYGLASVAAFWPVAGRATAPHAAGPEHGDSDSFMRKNLAPSPHTGKSSNSG